MNPIHRRACLALAACGALAALAGPGALAQTYPAKPITMVVPFPPGGPTDMVARLLAQKLSEQMGQPVVVDNKPGANGNIGGALVSKAAADGHTLLYNTSSITLSPALYKSMQYDVLRDLAPVALTAVVPLALVVNPAVPANSVQEFVAYAKAHSGKLSFGHGGNGTNPHLSALVLVRSLGVKAVEVPYKGNAPTAVALGGGEIDFAMLDYPSVRPLVERGNVRLLAVTEPKRVGMTPQVPTSGEQGLTRELDGMAPWFMLVAPASTPAPVINLLSQQAGAALGSPEVNKALASAGIEVETGSPAQAQRYFMEQRERMTRLARELKVSLKN